MSQNAKFFLKVVLSLFVFGLTWALSNQAAIITAVTIVVVWGLNTLAKRSGYQPGRAVVTAGLYVIAYLLVIFFNPSILPAFPVFQADATQFVGALIGYLQLVALALIPYSGAAMTIYNMLMQDVLEGLTFPLSQAELG